MKLSEALILRADLQKRAEQLRGRLKNNARIQEGGAPSEDPPDLLHELDAVLAELQELIKSINRTNGMTQTPNGTLTDLIAERDILKQKLSILREFCSSASVSSDRYSMREIRSISTVNVREIQKDVDRLSRQLRESDMRLQALNWETELA